MSMMFAFSARKKNGHLIKGVTADGLKKRIRSTVSGLALMCGLHTGAMMAFEKLPFQDAAWLTGTTVATVGYGDISAKTPAGRLSTIFLMYGAGIALMAQAASLVFESNQNKKERILTGKWRWNVDNHIVILNSPKNNPNGYFKRLMTEFRHSALPAAKKAVIIVSPNMPDGVSDELRQMDVAHVNNVPTEKQAFENSSLSEASVIAVLTQDENEAYSDSVTLDLVSRARAANPKAVIVAEALSDENRQRLLALGANHVIRPIRSYPELLVRTILAPGAENVIEEIFDSRGDECVRYNVSLKGKWGAVATSIIGKDIGMPLAYVGMNGQVVRSSSPNDDIEAQAIFVLAREGNIKTSAEVAKVLAADSGAPAKTLTLKAPGAMAG